MPDLIPSLAYVSAHRRAQLLEVLGEADGTLTDLYAVFEARDVGDDDEHDPDDLDEDEATASETAGKLLAKLVQLLTAENLTDQTTAQTVAHFAETGEFIPRESY